MFSQQTVDSAMGTRRAPARKGAASPALAAHLAMCACRTGQRSLGRHAMSRRWAQGRRWHSLRNCAHPHRPAAASTPMGTSSAACERAVAPTPKHCRGIRTSSAACSSTRRRPRSLTPSGLEQPAATTPRRHHHHPHPTHRMVVAVQQVRIGPRAIAVAFTHHLVPPLMRSSCKRTITSQRRKRRNVPH